VNVAIDDHLEVRRVVFDSSWGGNCCTATSHEQMATGINGDQLFVDATGWAGC
jgi:hypothetical protein